MLHDQEVYDIDPIFDDLTADEVPVYITNFHKFLEVYCRKFDVTTEELKDIKKLVEKDAQCPQELGTERNLYLIIYSETKM